jgi:enoyl-CoA hydratase/carnithine racemase
MEMIRMKRRDDVMILRLDRAVTNALNLQLIHELAKGLQGARDDPDIAGLVLASTNDKFFSIGFDIPGLFGLSKDDFTRFYQAFNAFCMDLYTFPKPTVAAITGHAIAGGCILALCCDYRFIAEGRKLMGLNEIKLGVPVPYVADCVLRQLVGTRNAREMIYLGEFYEPVALLQMGTVDQVYPLEHVVSSSVEQARALGALPREAFAVIKRNAVEMVEARLLERLAGKEQLFINCWYSEETRERLKAAMQRF